MRTKHLKHLSLSCSTYLQIRMRDPPPPLQGVDAVEYKNGHMQKRVNFYTILNPYLKFVFANIICILLRMSFVTALLMLNIFQVLLKTLGVRAVPTLIC